MSMWKKAMDYLGLGPDDAYDDYEVAPEPERAPRQARAPREEPSRQQRGHAPEYESETVRPVPARPSFPSRDDQPVRRPTPPTDDSNVQPRPINARPSVTARPAASSGGADPHTVRPRRFDAAQEVADKFKEGQPVIMNLEAADREVSRRLIDFASGLCYALDGTMEKVATGVYLLKPSTRSTGYDSTGYGA
ncbi:MAG: cell division protein SepF [Ilumatobacteraceae bacterium]